MTAVGTEVERRVRPGAILAIILVSYFMILLDNSVIFTGLPSIRAGLELTPTALSWVQDAYTLVFGGLLLLGARAGDIVGRRRLFTIGLAIFGGASLLIGLSPSGSWMIASRARAGLADVAPADAGAASGLVNTAHQLGMALGLGILVSASASAGTNLHGPAAVAAHVRAALTGSSVLLAVALLVTVTVISPRPRIAHALAVQETAEPV